MEEVDYGYEPSYMDHRGVWTAKKAIQTQCAEGFGQVYFDGPEYDHKRDGKRLASQHNKIKKLMWDGQWRSLREISEKTGAPEASVSSTLRDFRKPRFGSHTVEKKYVDKGLYLYRVIPNKLPL